MSAIIAGEACKDCGKEHYASLGHPEWFTEPWDSLNGEQKKQRTIFNEILASGRCLKCQLIYVLEQAAFLSSVLGID